MRLLYERTAPVVYSVGVPFRVHNFTAVSLAKTKDGESIRSAGDEIEEMLTRHLGKSRQVRQIAQRLADRIVERDFRGAIAEHAKIDALDERFMTEAFRGWLAVVAPEYELPKDFSVRTQDAGAGLIVSSGIDFDALNNIYHRRFPDASIDHATLLECVQHMRKEILFASEADTDVWLEPGEAAILKARMDVLASRLTKSKSNISTFHDVEFEGRSFREAINKGERTVPQLLDLLERDETRKFKNWLKAQPVDGSLVKEYDRAIFSKTGWTQSLSYKFGKLGVFAGLGVAVDLSIGTMGLATVVASGLGAASDVAVGASDEFLLSKLGKGWKPNQFIEGPAKEFVAHKTE
jgi:hypothetical protein